MKLTIKTRPIRYALLTIILGLVVYSALGFGQRSFEMWCPFGGMESLYGLFTAREFTCALSPLNLSMLVGVLALTLVAKKAFCGWACPIGFLGELGGRLGKLLWPKRPRVQPRVNSSMKLLRYMVLVLALYFTYRIGDLILRGYDPFYLIFSGFGHGSLGLTSTIVLGALVVGALAIPMFFCRYLCPLGATFDPLSRLGLVKITRDEQKCTQCNACQKACPHDLAPQRTLMLRHRDCTNCLECVDACPEKDVLTLRASL